MQVVYGYFSSLFKHFKWLKTCVHEEHSCLYTSVNKAQVFVADFKNFTRNFTFTCCFIWIINILLMEHKCMVDIWQRHCQIEWCRTMMIMHWRAVHRLFPWHACHLCVEKSVCFSKCWNDKKCEMLLIDTSCWSIQ